MALFADPKQLEEQTQHILSAASSWATEMHATVLGIQTNTNQIFFWSMFVGAGVGLAVTLWTLNRLRDELRELNHHQVIYRSMWIDERNQMHKQISENEKFQDEHMDFMQMKWRDVEADKRIIMEKGLQQQRDIARAIREGAVAQGSPGQIQIPRPGDPDYELFKDAMVDYAKSRLPSQGYDGRRQ
ncbi:hypothetical protein PG990_001505 [Apiospora arundinis]